MNKPITLCSTLLLTLGVSAAAMAQQNSPYAYVYAVYGGTQVNGVTLTNVATQSPHTAFNLPTGGLPAKLSQTDKNTGLVTAYTTTSDQKALNVTLTYVVNAGVGPSTCNVTVSTPNIQDKAQQLSAVISNGCTAGALFNPVYSTNPVDGDQVVTINWKLE